MSDSAYIYDFVRTPFGRYGKTLADTRPDDLAGLVVGEIARRNSSLNVEQVDDIILGDANAAGEDNRNVARMAALLAGFPTSIPGVTVNRLCGSGMEATIQASRAIETGDASVVISGGVESMTRAPWVMLKPKSGFPAGNEMLHSTTLGWRMVNPTMDKRWTISLVKPQKSWLTVTTSLATSRMPSQNAATNVLQQRGKLASSITRLFKFLAQSWQQTKACVLTPLSNH